jgi:hypothetical protein
MSEGNSGLVDIVEPLAPVVVAMNGGIWLAVAGAVLAALALGVYFWWKYKLPAYRTLKALKQLQLKLHTKELTPHESLLMLALDLRHGLGVKRLRSDIFPAQLKQQDHTAWVEFMQQLDHMLYEKDAALSEDKLMALFEQAEYWLRRYSRKSTLKKMSSITE